MIRSTLIILSILINGLISNIQSQVIIGKVVVKYIDTYDGIYGVKITLDSTSIFTDEEGNFSMNAPSKHSRVILFDDGDRAKLKIINLPTNIKTLKFDKVELINHGFITKEQYDSIRLNLILTFKDKDLLIVKQRNADALLLSKYEVVNCWSEIIGYKVRDSIRNYNMLNPFDRRTYLQIEYDNSKDLITLDYEKIKK